MADSRVPGGDADDFPDVEHVDEGGPVQEVPTGESAAVGTEAKPEAAKPVEGPRIEPGPDSGSGGDHEPAMGPAPHASAGSALAQLWQRLAAGHRRLALIGGAVVLVLVVGLLATVTSSGGDGAGSGGSEQGWEPFEEALADLEEARGLRYADTTTVGSQFRDITVTDEGWAFGQTGFQETGTDQDLDRELEDPERPLEDLDQDVLSVDGKAYSRYTVAPDYELEQIEILEDAGGDDPADEPDTSGSEETDDGDEGAGSRPGMWTYDFFGDSDELAATFAQFPTPGDLASDLRAAMDQLRESPDPGRRVSETTVDDVPALQAETPAGRLFVAAEPPYGVLRLEPYGIEDLRDLAEQIEEGQDPNGSIPELPGEVTAGPLVDSQSEGMDLFPIAEEAAELMYDALEAYIKPLTQASDGGIDFTLDGSGDINCSASGCRVTENFTGQVATYARGRLADARVQARLTATITIDGQPAGRCASSPQTFRVDGGSVSGSLSCSAPEAGPVFASTDAQYRRQAEAQSAASGGREVPYSFPYGGEAWIDATAIARVEVDSLLDQVRRDRDTLPCATRGNSFSGNTKPQGHLYWNATDLKGQKSRDLDPDGRPLAADQDEVVVLRKLQTFGFDVCRNRDVGIAAENQIASRYPGSRQQVAFQTESGRRRVVDVLTPEGLAIESKVGRTDLRSRTRRQIARDVALLEEGRVDGLRWEFSRSPTTRKAGPTPRLAEALDREGIPWEIVD